MISDGTARWINEIQTGTTVLDPIGSGSSEDMTPLFPRTFELELHYDIISYWLVDRVFTDGLGDQGSIQVASYQRLKTMELDTSLLNTQHYKVTYHW